MKGDDCDNDINDSAHETETKHYKPLMLFMCSLIQGTEQKRITIHNL